MTATVTCNHCQQKAQVRSDGTLAVHYLVLKVSARAVTSVGAGTVKRRCSGSERPATTTGRTANP
jgi:hypothetical protein